MAQGEVRKSILIADDDLGFVVWAGSVLAGAGYQTWPATTADDGLEWLKEPEVVFDLLLISPSLESARELVEAARDKSPRLKVAALSVSDHLGDVIIDAALPKPGDAADEASAWVGTITRLLTPHLTA
ncbi:MAG: hypothetical protein JO323_14010 [Acidobacteriia bacterium]|nr:hypothetical protein [Terriglobia bacterium]